MAGKNLFGLSDSQRFLEKRAQSERPCVFLSHASVDKPVVRRIADWIKDRDVNVYFDEEDRDLKAAMHMGASQAVVKCIQDGLNKSDYALCVMSRNTLESQWVPYEIGYSASQSKPLALAVLSEVSRLPQFYSLATVLPDINQLDSWLDSILRGTSLLLDSVQKKANVDRYNLHPLTNYMPRSRNITFY